MLLTGRSVSDIKIKSIALGGRHGLAKAHFESSRRGVMAEILLKQSEGDALLAMEKMASGNDPVSFPGIGETLDIHLHGEGGQEEFVLNYTRSSINISKRNHHLRVRTVIGLARLDLDGPPHRNPDGQEVGPRHLHLYREGYGLKWAFEVPANRFSDLNDALATLKDFMRFCNVVGMPDIRKESLI